MATKLRLIVDDLLTDLRQLSDDSEIEFAQVAHWVIMVGNRLKSQHIAKRDSGQHLSIFTEIPIGIFSANDNASSEVKGRKYIILPKSIFDYDNDKGIEYMSYYVDHDDDECPPPFTKQTFARTSPSASRRLYFSKYERPSPKNPFFYRVGEIVYLLGLECINPKFLEIGIYSTLDPVTDITSVDENFDFPDELLHILKKQVFDLARFTLLMPQDRLNDGSDASEGNIPTNKIVSVNERGEDSPVKQ